ncbi:hypothetical protein FUMI01_12430 [Flavobacterium sp. UMI-01]|nr:hypothetical protein FUMI01_12430 [Flavobacterium sp. UMI-01]
MPQVPPPPQAEGKNIFLFESVASSEAPASVSNSSSLFITIFTRPDGVNLDLAYKMIYTKSELNNKKTIMLEMIVVVSILNRIIFNWIKDL